MSNRLKMATVHSIHLLRSLHWSHRRIARELGIDRGTVRRHLLAGMDGSNAAIPPGESGDGAEQTSGISEQAKSTTLPEANAAIPPTGSEPASAAPRRRKTAATKSASTCES